MQKKLYALLLVGAALAVPVGFAWALRVAPPPGPARVTGSDLVFIGKVTEIEPAELDVKQFPGAKNTVKYKIAVIKITDAIRGVKEVKSVRVGFIAPAPRQPGVPIIGGGRGGPALQVGQEGLFMLKMHASGQFYDAPDFGYFTPAAQQNFADEVKTARKVVAIINNTKGALESKENEERMIAASLLIGKYRQRQGAGPFREEPIDAAESKLILNALANANWKVTRYGDPNPYQLFTQLGVTAKDGWNQPKKIKSQDDLRNAVQAWIRDKGDSYRIKRWVAQNEK